MRRWGRILLEPLAATVLWGGVFTAAKLAMQEIPVLAFAVVRLLLAMVLLAALSWGGERPRLDGRAWRSLAGAGLAQTAFQLSLLYGILLTSASVSAILLATSPLLTAAWLAATGRAQLHPKQWLGLGIGLAGVVLVVAAHGGGGQQVTLVGSLVALGAGATWAWYGVAIAPLARAIGAVRASAATLGVAAVLIGPLGATALAGVAWIELSLAAWSGLAYSVVLGLVLATVLWVRSIERWGTQETMGYTYVEPVAGIIIAAVLLGETLGPVRAIGAVLALLGVYLASEAPQA